jgi:hypothetical protein
VRAGREDSTHDAVEFGRGTRDETSPKRGISDPGWSGSLTWMQQRKAAVRRIGLANAASPGDIRGGDRQRSPPSISLPDAAQSRNAHRVPGDEARRPVGGCRRHRGVYDRRAGAAAVVGPVPPRVEPCLVSSPTLVAQLGGLRATRITELKSRKCGIPDRGQIRDSGACIHPDS